MGLLGYGEEINVRKKRGRHELNGYGNTSSEKELREVVGE